MSVKAGKYPLNIMFICTSPIQQKFGKLVAKNSLKIPKGYSEAVIRMADNTLVTHIK